MTVIRALSRRARWLVAVVALEALFAWAVARGALRTLPDGANVLLAHGGRGVLDLAAYPRAVAHGVGLIVAAVGVYALLVALAGSLWPMVLALRPGTSVRTTARELAARAGSFLALAVAQGLCVALVAAASVVVARAAWAFASGLADVRVGRVVLAAALTPGALLMAWLAIVFDLARTHVAGRRASWLDGIAHGWHRWTHERAALTHAYATVVFATVACLVWVWRAEASVSSRGPWSVAGALVVQQIAFATRVVVRAAWWAWLAISANSSAASALGGDTVDGA